MSLDEEAKKIFESIYQVAERNLVIFGAGVRGKHCLDVFDNLEFQCFVDNNAKNIRGRKEENQVLPIFTLEECLGQIESPVFIVCNKSWYREIISQLLTAGVPQEDIIDFTTLANQYLERQYFDLPKLKEVKQEGAFIALHFENVKSNSFYRFCKERLPLQ